VTLSEVEVLPPDKTIEVVLDEDNISIDTQQVHTEGTTNIAESVDQTNVIDHLNKTASKDTATIKTDGAIAE
jgi:hypothetical protein